MIGRLLRETSMSRPEFSEEDIFQAARRIPPGEARRAYLELACSTDTELRARVEALLRAFEDSRSFLELPAAAIAACMNASEESPATIVGPLCTPLDTLARKAVMPDLGAGDIIAVLQSGAYGRTASPVGFLSHPLPTEILIDNGNVEIIHLREAQ